MSSQQTQKMVVKENGLHAEKSEANLEDEVVCEDSVEDRQDIYIKPIVSLPLVDVITHEEDEDEMVKLRAKLYRYDQTRREWKERGRGEVKLLRHRENHTVRVVMRRDQTFKVCANHYIIPEMKLIAHCKSKRAFNWFVPCDFADEKCKPELLAIEFQTEEIAALWKTKFMEGQDLVREGNTGINENQPQSSNSSESKDNPDQTKEVNADGVVLQLNELSVGDKKPE